MKHSVRSGRSLSQARLISLISWLNWISKSSISWIFWWKLVSLQVVDLHLLLYNLYSPSLCSRELRSPQVAHVHRRLAYCLVDYLLHKTLFSQEVIREPTRSLSLSAHSACAVPPHYLCFVPVFVQLLQQSRVNGLQCARMNRGRRLCNAGEFVVCEVKT